jgi:group I intron endonuclease
MQIYKITNLITGKVYIGQTIMTLKRRWAVHRAAKRDTPLCRSIKKHGADKFKIEAICSALTEEALDDLEILFIKEYNSLAPNGYNILPGGNASQCRGQSAWNKGRKATEEEKTALSLAHMGQTAWNKGVPTSLETREKQSKAKLGRHISPVTEFKPGQLSKFKGKKHSPASLALISLNGNRRPIVCVETGQIFRSIIEAAIQLEIAKSHLRRCVLSGKAAKGLHFRFSP